MAAVLKRALPDGCVGADRSASEAGRVERSPPVHAGARHRSAPTLAAG